MERIIEKVSASDWVIKISLLSILLLFLHAKYLSPVMGEYTWLYSFSN